MNSKNLYLDINVLQSVPSSNINRDDTGAPKTAIYGGVTRSRVSSQSWKRVIRQAFRDQSSNAEWLLSHRTTHAIKLISEKIIDLDASVSKDEAIDKALELFKAAKIKTKKDKDTSEYLTGALLLLSNGQIEKLARYALSNEEINSKELKKVLMSNQSLDLALFGRMVADNPELNVDASTQVAHAISTHQVVPEFDYFTAVDDDRNKDNAGSAMIGTMEYNAATLYRYANVNINNLMHNLGSSELLKQGIRLFIKDFITTMPTGKENSYANKTMPAYVMVALRDDTPVNLVSAFEEPVKSKDGYIKKSIIRLEREYQATQKIVDQPLGTFVLTTKDSSLKEDASNIDDLLQKVVDSISKQAETNENDNN